MFMMQNMMQKMKHFDLRIPENLKVWLQNELQKTPEKSMNSWIIEAIREKKAKNEIL